MPGNPHKPHRLRHNIGVIGLGIIGSRVAETLRRKGFQVFVWNRTPRPVPNFVGAPSEIAEMCHYIQLFVSDDDALLQIVQNLAPSLAPRHIVMAHCTVAPHSMRAAADIVEGRGARFVEAPFTGSKLAAESGELVYYVGGDETVIRETHPILEASSKKIIEIGEIGQATAIKIATNMVTAASVEAAAEALALIQTTGVPLEKFALAMEGNASNSATLSMKLPRIIERNFEPHFSLKHMLKDMQIAARYGLSQHLELAVTAAARDRLLEQMQRGFGDEDYSAVARKYLGGARPGDRLEAGLELFEKPAPIEPYPFTTHETSATSPEAIAENPVAEQPAPPELVPNVSASFETESVNAPEAAQASEPLPVSMTDAGIATEQNAESPPPQDSIEEEEPARRGLLSRLLRRSHY
jgi:3-hydroxyisobutyrate dehydrogenase-like beta-hydroxyacid dehydrogenase